MSPPPAPTPTPQRASVTLSVSWGHRTRVRAVSSACRPGSVQNITQSLTAGKRAIIPSVLVCQTALLWGSQGDKRRQVISLHNPVSVHKSLFPFLCQADTSYQICRLPSARHRAGTDQQELGGTRGRGLSHPCWPQQGLRIF